MTILTNMLLVSKLSCRCTGLMIEKLVNKCSKVKSVSLLPLFTPICYIYDFVKKLEINNLCVTFLLFSVFCF